MRILPLSVSSKYRQVKKVVTSPEAMADVITKGKYSIFKSLVEIGAGRPDIPEARMIQSGVQLPPIRSYAFLKDLERKVSIVRSVDLKLKQEIFRNGGDWQPRYISKCADELCGEEFQETVEICPRCQGKNFLQPSTVGKEDFDRIVEKANFNDQTLLEVLDQIEEDLNIGDDAYIVTPKKILADSGEGPPMLWPTEVFRGDPDLFRKVTDKRGLPGGKYWKCLRCREEDGTPYIKIETDRNKAASMRCPQGHELYEVFFVATDFQGTEPRYYYIKGEVLHVSKYSPSLLYGFSPLVTLYNESIALFHIDRRIRMRMEKGRVEGIITFPMKNDESLEKAKKRMAEEKMADDNYLAMVAVDPDAKHMPTFIQLLGSFGDNQVLELKQELKERIGGLYGVSLVFQADTSTSGGLNNEGIQITVTNRAVEKGQGTYNDKVLPHLMKQYGVIDYVWTLNPNEERDMVAEEDLKAKKIANATALLTLGYVSKLQPNGDWDPEFDPDQAMELRTGAGALQPPIGISPDNQRFTGEPDDLRRSDEDIQDSMEKFIDPRTDDILEALSEGALFSEFETLTKAQVRELRKVMLTSMTQPQGWSINSVVKKLEEVLPEGAQKNLRTIVRTETQSINNVARKLEYDDRDPEGMFKYQWIGPNDRRTTDTCKNITRRASKGVSLEELQKIIDAEAKKEGFDPRPLLPHINCRHTLRRVVL